AGFEPALQRREARIGRLVVVAARNREAVLGADLDRRRRAKPAGGREQRGERQRERAARNARSLAPREGGGGEREGGGVAARCRRAGLTQGVSLRNSGRENDPS